MISRQGPVQYLDIPAGQSAGVIAVPCDPGQVLARLSVAEVAAVPDDFTVAGYTHPDAAANQPVATPADPFAGDRQGTAPPELFRCTQVQAAVLGHALVIPEAWAPLGNESARLAGAALHVRVQLPDPAPTGGRRFASLACFLTGH